MPRGKARPVTPCGKPTTLRYLSRVGLAVVPVNLCAEHAALVYERFEAQKKPHMQAATPDALCSFIDGRGASVSSWKSKK